MCYEHTVDIRVTDTQWIFVCYEHSGYSCVTDTQWIFVCYEHAVNIRVLPTQSGYLCVANTQQGIFVHATQLHIYLFTSTACDGC